MFVLISYVFNRLDWISRTCMANDELSRLIFGTDSAFPVPDVVC
jgi:hypothetical protein